MTQNLSIYEQLEFSTTRIECYNDDGTVKYGTGFFYRVEDDRLENNSFIPVVLTNKHVVENMRHACICFSRSDSDGNPIFGEPYKFRFDLSSGLVFYHPNDNVDLCAIAFQPLVSRLPDFADKLFFRTFDKSLIPSEQQLKKLDSIEDILMIGYPNALWDEKNNMPLVRKGITASPVWLDFNGRKEFVIDAACFPGSSGSPILLCNIGSVRSKNGGLQLGTSRVYLLGVLYGGPQLMVEGDIRVKTIPDAQQKPYSVSAIPNNLGYILKSERIIELNDFILSQLNLHGHK